MSKARTPKAHLISFTANPLETIYWIWHSSKGNYELDFSKVPPADELRDLFVELYNQEIPVIENIQLNYILEDVSISFREQMVRHRVGTKFDDRLGVDIVPELNASSWWSQSYRILGLEDFYSAERYKIADSIASKPEAEELFRNHMMEVEDVYNQLLEMGVEMEDARDVIPLSSTHRISWALNLRAMKHIIGLRSCWVAQSSLWHAVIRSMIKQAAEKIHPVFSIMAYPPCVDKRKDEYQACVLTHENDRRMESQDNTPLCPLWLCREKGFDPNMETQGKIPMMGEMMKRAEQYGEFWGHDPYLWDKGR
jgi:thymidylate synthase ThyX